MRLKTTLLAAVATLAVAPAAHAYEGLYGAIGAGLSHLGDRSVDIFAPIVSPTLSHHNNGIGVYTALGYDWGNDWRTEVELSYRNNDMVSWDPSPGFTGIAPGSLNGDVSNFGLMFNLVRDFDFGTFFTPYLGIGAGFAHTEAEWTGTTGAPNVIVVDDSDRRFAYQGIAGVAFELAENLMLDVSYRYYETLDNKLAGTVVTLATPFVYELDYRSHSVFAGLRWNFGSGGGTQYKDCPDGSSIPVSAECPALVEQVSATPDPIDVTVYFDYDKSNLSVESDALVREAAQRALQNDIQTVKVEGNADRSGGSAYNQALSQRRANVVRDALVAYGVPADRIQTSAFGEDNPAKPTEDGVREPLNRRTEVTISFE